MSIVFFDNSLNGRYSQQWLTVLQTRTKYVCIWCQFKISLSSSDIQVIVLMDQKIVSFMKNAENNFLNATNIHKFVKSIQSKEKNV